MPAHFENGRKLDGKNSFQDFDTQELYLHPTNRSVSSQKHLKMFCFHHFQVFTRCRFQMCRLEFRFQIYRFPNLPANCAVFVSTGGLSVEFFTAFKMCRHRVNTVFGKKIKFVRISYIVLLSFVFLRRCFDFTTGVKYLIKVTNNPVSRWSKIEEKRLIKQLYFSKILSFGYI